MNNVSTQEIAKFSAIAPEWWDRNGALKTLHDITPLRAEFIAAHCHLQNTPVLDVGCGGGILSEALAMRGAQVTGIDLSEAALMVAREHAAKQKLSITYHLNSVEAFAEQYPNTYPIVTCLELLEHVPDPVAVVQAIATLLAPNGIAIFSTLNRNAKSYVQAIVAAEYVLKMVPIGTHDYAQFIRPSELARWARQADLEVTALQGMRYQPFEQTYTLSADVSVNYFMVCRKHG